MTVVVADTSSLNYLVLIGQIEILHSLYGKIVVPPEVRRPRGCTRTPSDIDHPETPPAVEYRR